MKETKRDSFFKFAFSNKGKPPAKKPDAFERTFQKELDSLSMAQDSQSSKASFMTEQDQSMAEGVKVL